MKEQVTATATAADENSSSSSLSGSSSSSSSSSNRTMSSESDGAGTQTKESSLIDTDEQKTETQKQMHIYKSRRKRATTIGHEYEENEARQKKISFLDVPTAITDSQKPPRDCAKTSPGQKSSRGRRAEIEKDSRAAWLTIASTCFVAYGTVYGTTYTFPVLYTALEHHFGNGSEHQRHAELISFRISWIGSACFGMSNFLCLFSGLLTELVSTQLLLLVGACAGATGILVSSFADSLEVWYVAYVCVTGLGNACIYLAVVTTLSENFDRHFALANGVTSLGSGVMQTVFPFIWQHLLINYGLRAMLYFMAACYASLALFVPLWRSPSHPYCFSFRRVVGNTSDDDVDANADDSDASKSLPNVSSTAHDPTPNGTLHASLMHLHSKAERRMRSEMQQHSSLNPLTKPLSISLITSISTESSETEEKNDWCKLELFRNRRYLIFLVGMLLYQIGTAAPDMFIVSYTDDKFHTTGMDSLVPLISYSITMCFAKLAFSKLLGSFSHNLSISMLVFQLGPCLNGIVMSLIPVSVSRFNSYKMMVFTCVLWGLSDGPVDALLAPVIRLLVGPRLMARAVGYCVAICMSSSMLGPPLAGLILDTLRTYDITFCISSTLIFLGTCTLFLVSWVRDPGPDPGPGHDEVPPIVVVVDDVEKDLGGHVSLTLPEQEKLLAENRPGSQENETESSHNRTTTSASSSNCSTTTKSELVKHSVCQSDPFGCCVVR